jgi:hypothetical protein
MASNALVRRPQSLVRRALSALRPTTTKSTTPAAAQVFYPPSPFLTWTYKRISSAIADAFERQTIDISQEMADLLKVPQGAMSYKTATPTNPILINRAFYGGDHWQSGAGYIGPHPNAADKGAQTAMQEISLGFTSKNAIKESTKRHRSGVVGKQIKWHYGPKRDLKEGEKTTPEEDTAIDEATQFVRGWLHQRGVFATVQNAVTTLLLSERADIRMEIPPGLATVGKDGSLSVSAPDVLSALRFIYLSHPLPDDAALIIDPSTQSEAALWRYEAPQKGTENDDEPKMEKHVAICYIDESGETVTRIFSESSPETPVVPESSAPMGGRALMYEMKRDALITPQIQQAQRGLNLALTMIPRTAVTAGFLERVLIDMQLPADPELDAEGNPTGKWVRKPFAVGASTTNFFQSSEYMDEEGQVKRAQGDMKWREPVSADGPIKAAAQHYHDILQEVGQIHIIMSGDATASGASRLMARIEYLNTLLDTKPTVEACFRWILDTVLALAEAISGKEGQYTNLIQAEATCRLDAGPLTPEERTAIENSIGKTLSRETAMLMLGVEDVDAEKSRMESDPMARTAFVKSLGDALTSMTTSGGTFEGTCEYIGIPKKDVDLLLSGDVRIVPEHPADPTKTPPPAPGGPTPGPEPTAKTPAGADRPLNPNPSPTPANA